MTEVTRILDAIAKGDPVATGQLLPLVYDELRRLAARQLAQLPQLGTKTTIFSIGVRRKSLIHGQ